MTGTPLILVLIICVSTIQSGTPVNIDVPANLAILNAERSFWNLPLLAWDNNLQTLAQKHADTCNFGVLDLVKTSGEYAELTGVPYDPLNKPQTIVGELQAGASAGQGTNTDFLLKFTNTSCSCTSRSRDDFNCLNDACNLQAPNLCLVYKQVVNLKTKYVGCAITSGCTIQGSTMDFLVCMFVTAVNFNGAPTFVDDATKTAICNHNYTVPTPPQPPACGNCNTSCPNPDSNVSAVCGLDGVWTFPAGDVNISSITQIKCPVKVNGNIIGQGPIFMNHCGKLTVSGNSNVNAANTYYNLDMDNVGGLAPGSYFDHPILTMAGGTAPSVVNTFNVFSPYKALCSQIVGTPTASYVRFYDCADTPDMSVPPTLPPGGSLPNGVPNNDTSVSSGKGSVSKSEPGPEPPATAPAPDSGNGNGPGGLPWWAIFLIVIACIIGFLLLVGLIIFVIIQVAKWSNDPERA